LGPVYLSGNKAKKLAALEIVNVLFKIYFKLNTIRLCASIIRAVNSPAFAAFEDFPPSHRVTYKYYLGRLAILDENYVRHCVLCSSLEGPPIWLPGLCPPARGAQLNALVPTWPGADGGWEGIDRCMDWSRWRVGRDG
jgi:hypothetical protein